MRCMPPSSAPGLSLFLPLLHSSHATPQKILQRLKLQVGIEALFIADGGVWPRCIVMAGEHDGAVVELGQLLGQAVVHIFRVAAWEDRSGHKRR